MDSIKVEFFDKLRRGTAIRIRKCNNCDDIAISLEDHYNFVSIGGAKNIAEALNPLADIHWNEHYRELESRSLSDTPAEHKFNIN